jgi:hypothetical protein
MFDWEVGNGGLRQYFLNFENRPWFLPLVLDGYTTSASTLSGAS